MAAGLESADLLRIGRWPLADIELVPMRHTRYLRQFIDLVSGGQGGLHCEGAGCGDHQAAKRGNQNFFLLLVHLVLDGSFVELTLPEAD
jgi:hypothetical protein